MFKKDVETASAGGRAGFNKIGMGFKKANYNFLLYLLSCLLYGVAPPCDPLAFSNAYF